MAAGLTTLLLGYYLFVGDTTPLGEYLTIWPPLLWAFVLVPLLLLTLRRTAWWRSVAIGCGILLFFAATVEWSSLFRMPPAKERLESTIGILSWNIDGGSAPEAVLQEMQKYEPDICFLQESSDSPAFPEAVKALSYWQEFTYTDAGDCALLSRWPVEELASREVGPWSAPQLAKVALPSGKTLLLANVRLMLPSLILLPVGKSWTRLKRDHELRTAQFAELASLLEETARAHQVDAIVLGGDFNTPGGAKSLKPSGKD